MIPWQDHVGFEKIGKNSGYGHQIWIQKYLKGTCLVQTNSKGNHDAIIARSCTFDKMT